MDKAARTLDKETSDKVAFLSFIIPEFAKSYKMTMPDSYLYLKKYGAWDYLNENKSIRQGGERQGSIFEFYYS